MSVVATIPAWLVGITIGDGYLDDRHVEVYNSSKFILKEVAKSIKQELKFPVDRIMVDVYSLTADKEKWSKILDIPEVQIKLRPNSSPWNATFEKLRIRISSKETATQFSEFYKKIMHKTRSEKIEFVKGLFDAEGSVDLKGKIEFKQVKDDKGLKVVRVVHKILSELGIKCTKPKVKHDMKKDDFYFYVKDLEKFKSLIGFVDMEKTQKLDIIIKTYKSEKIPSEEEILSALKKEPCSMFKLIQLLKSPHYRIQRKLKGLADSGMIKRVRAGRQIIYSSS
ncbi:MAG: hypothetical protein HY361_03050 [Candidatus Aenigmarchaeota archaeon]|nr:hypothetical protein [Candidatus Aenigmarchaeota archaeon]